MNKQHRPSPTLTVGGSSLVVIFAVLCLTVFALLGLDTVQADKRLSDSAAAATAEYYAADYQAELIFARLRQGQLPHGVDCTDGVYSYSCVISDTQQLQVQLRCSNGSWQVLRWQAVSAVDWQADETIDVWVPTD